MDEGLSKYLKNPTYVGLVAFGVGVTIGYILGKKNRQQVVYEPPSVSWRDHFTKESLDELDAIRRKHETGEEIPPEVLEAARLAFNQRHNISEEDEIREEDVPDEPTVSFASEIARKNAGWDYEVEVNNRTEARPYVLHRDEFYADEREWTQSTLTYYAGDNIMADEDDTPVYNYETIVGPVKFGHGSDDPNVFYVRNPKYKAEYEILYDPGLYSVEVLGLEIENNDRVKGLKHADRKGLRD